MTPHFENDHFEVVAEEGEFQVTIYFGILLYQYVLLIFVLSLYYYFTIMYYYICYIVLYALLYYYYYIMLCITICCTSEYVKLIIKPQNLILKIKNGYKLALIPFVSPIGDAPIFSVSLDPMDWIRIGKVLSKQVCSLNSDLIIRNIKETVHKKEMV